MVDGRFAGEGPEYAKLRDELPEGTRTRRLYEVWVEKDDADHTVVNVGTASALA